MCAYAYLKVRSHYAATCNQCDQMTRLVVQFLAITHNENIPLSIKYLPKVGSKWSQILNKSSISGPKKFVFCQIGEISPNLVTLAYN